MRLTDYVLAGYLDYQEHTPWKRAPQTEDEAMYGETEEQTVYWDGFYAGTYDALARMRRERSLHNTYRKAADETADKTLAELKVRCTSSK